MTRNAASARLAGRWICTLAFVAALACASKQGISQPSDHKIFVDSVNHIADVLKWRHLSDDRAKYEDEEIRVWVGFGIEYPMQALRLRRTGRKWQGDVVRWWENADYLYASNTDESRAFVSDVEHGCGQIYRRDFVVCVVPLASADAERYARQLDQLGVWTVRDPVLPKSGLFTVMFDGTSALIERRRNGIYAALEFAVASPDAWDYDIAAAQIAALVEDAASPRHQREQ